MGCLFGEGPKESCSSPLLSLFNLLICPSNKSKNGRAPLGFTYWVGGLLVEPPKGSLLVERAYAS